MLQIYLDKNIYDSLKFIIPLIFAIITFFSFYSEIKFAISKELLDRNAEFTDMLMFLFKAEKPFNLENKKDFRFPFGWLMNQLYIAFLIGKYPFSELYDNHGAFVLIKGGSRNRWIISKFLWTFIVCVLYYALMILCIMVLCMIFKIPITFVLKPTVSEFFVTSDHKIGGDELLKIFLLPLLTSIAFSSVQPLISLVTHSIYGFAFVLGFCGISVFTNSIIAFGNCSMLIRNKKFYYSDIKTNNSIILLIAIIIIAFISSLIYFKKCDILHNKKDE